MRKHSYNPRAVGLTLGALAFLGLGAWRTATYEAPVTQPPGAVEHHPGHWVVTGADCPTEDSCVVTWQDGHYQVQEVTP